MHELSHFYIEFAPAPTAHNRTILISVHELRGTLVHMGNEVELSRDYLNKFGFRPEHVVFKVYRDGDGAREIYYEHRGYGPHHISSRLDTMIDREIKEKYV